MILMYCLPLLRGGYCIIKGYDKRVELAFEGSRLFDIRRWQIGAQVMNGTVYGAPDPAKDYLWPIPVREMQGNSNMVQAPGY